MFWIWLLAGFVACVVVAAALLVRWMWKHKNDNWINF